MENLQEIFHLMLNKEYYTEKELCYGKNAGLFLSNYAYRCFLDYKKTLLDQNHPSLEKLDLYAWDDKPLFFAKSNDLESSYHFLEHILRENLSSSWNDEILKSRIYSEIEGSLSIEKVPTTRRKISEIISGKRKPENENDVIIKNMGEGIRFVLSKPNFNETNLHILYNVLSDGCLSEENKLKEGQLYRYDRVEVDNYLGCPIERIHSAMDSLFSFVEKNLHNPKMKHILPHIVHYYLLYVHPYFDYNGRTARMSSFWIEQLIGEEDTPAVLSEAINQRKNEYYLALENTRDARNDLTYFLKYVYVTLSETLLCYENVEHVSQNLQDKDILLTETEKNYLRKILLSYKGKFTYNDFEKMAKIDVSKQGALKILNRFVSYGLLIPSESNSKSKLFALNADALSFLSPRLKKYL